MRAACLLLLLGCGSDKVDACSNVSVDPCVTFHLTGDSTLADSLVTAVAMWATYQTGVLNNKLVQTTMTTATPFPIGVGLELPPNLSGAAKIRIAALNGPGPVGYRVVSVMPGLGEHADVDVVLQRPDPSTGCFNGLRNPGESDIDCGGDCPPCAAGRHCSSAADCLSTSCVSGTLLCN